MHASLIPDARGLRAAARAWRPGALLAALLLLAPLPGAVQAQQAAYTVHPGDVLQISVWREEDLQREVLVRPDGGFSFPLAGDIQARGKSVVALQEELASRIERYIPDPVVTVSLGAIQGNKMYVVGKVNRPGEFVMTGDVDVMQALAIAGGTTPFAALKDIQILRRVDGEQRAIPFRYPEVERGENLEQNIVLESGDIVVVP